MAIQVTLTDIQKSFYLKENSFNNFDELSSKDVESLIKRNKQTNIDKGSKIALYKNALMGINAWARQEHKTFDEKMLALIMEIDPELLMYHTYDKATITTQAQIENADDELKPALLEQRRNELNQVVSDIRNVLGFYDSKMLKYESILFRKFLKPQKLVTESAKDFTQNILKNARIVRSFSRITDERYKEITDLVVFWENETKAIGNSKLASYTLCNQNDILRLDNIMEQLLFFIMAVDPELKMLTIYEEESRINEVKRKVKEEFGFNSTEMIRLERLYHQRFCPDKKLSAWSL